MVLSNLYIETLKLKIKTNLLSYIQLMFEYKNYILKCNFIQYKDIDNLNTKKKLKQCNELSI